METTTTYTHEEILSMEADEELDHLIATEVMGWRLIHFGGGVTRWYAAELTTVNGKEVLYSSPTTGPEGFHPSHDMTDAMRVVAHLQRWRMQLRQFAVEWECMLTNTGHPFAKAEALRPALAIARAALLTTLDDELRHG